MTTKTSTDKPSVDLNLDVYEAAEERKPFAVVLGGKRFVFTHMDDLEAWDVVNAFLGGEVEATVSVIEQALGDDYEEFRSKPLKKGKFDHLVKSYMAHCGVNAGE